MKLLRWIRKAADTVMPYLDKCEACGTEKDVESFLCPSCREEIEALRHGETTARELRAFSVYNYDGLISKIVRGYKYNGKRYLADFIAGEMAPVVPKGTDAISYVPLHSKRHRQRGFDQAQLLAESISKITGIPFVRAAQRTRNTKTQVSLGLSARQENMKGAFAAEGKVSGSVVLVDDVLTTGATAAECAGALIDAGASDVFVLTFARSTGDSSTKRKWSLRSLFRQIT